MPAVSIAVKVKTKNCCPYGATDHVVQSSLVKYDCMPTGYAQRYSKMGLFADLTAYSV